jgi:hypothetical protein
MLRMEPAGAVGAAGAELQGRSLTGIHSPICLTMTICLFRAHWDWLGRQRRPNRRSASAGKISDKDDYGHSDYLPPTAPNKWPRAADFMSERFLVSHT